MLVNPGELQIWLHVEQVCQCVCLCSEFQGGLAVEWTYAAGEVWDLARLPVWQRGYVSAQGICEYVHAGEPGDVACVLYMPTPRTLCLCQPERRWRLGGMFYESCVWVLLNTAPGLCDHLCQCHMFLCVCVWVKCSALLLVEPEKRKALGHQAGLYWPDRREFWVKADSAVLLYYLNWK